MASFRGYGAIASYMQALSMEPHLLPALTSLGMALYRNGNLAQRAYERTLAINPTSTEALANIGAVFYEQGRINVAEAEFTGSD